MRYLLDTNIFIYLSTDHDKLDPNVFSILSEPETLMYISAESVRELIVAKIMKKVKHVHGQGNNPSES